MARGRDSNWWLECGRQKDEGAKASDAPKVSIKVTQTDGDRAGLYHRSLGFHWDKQTLFTH